MLEYVTDYFCAEKKHIKLVYAFHLLQWYALEKFKTGGKKGGIRWDFSWKLLKVFYAFFFRLISAAVARRGDVVSKFSSTFLLLGVFLNRKKVCTCKEENLMIDGLFNAFCFTFYV